MNQTHSKIISYIIAAILIAIGIDMLFDAYRTATKGARQEAVEVIDRSDWITYTNTNYGYEISYPPTVEFVRSSETNLQPAEASRQDQIVFIGDRYAESIYIIVAGANVEYTATSSSDLKGKFSNITMQNEVSSELGELYSLSSDDYHISETVLNGQPAIEVQSPANYTLMSINDSNQVFSVVVGNFSNSTSTPKDRLTREIIETFRVLD